ncbi:MAG TPA: ATP-binding cassette domain-containing protein, partial [Solirubrobacteraceae bacterium]
MCELLSVRSVSKSFVRGEELLPVLVDVSLEVAEGEIVAVVGSRDSGKTTLLRVAAGMARPEQGEVWFADRELTGFSDAKRSRLFGREIAWTDREGPGVRLKVRDFAGLPLTMGRRLGRREVRDLALEALERVGIPGCAGQRWEELSKWEQVLVGLARGIVSRPRLLIIDDLLDGLGMKRTQEVGDLLGSLVAELGCGVLMGVSDLEAALVADRVWSFTRGRLKLISDQSGTGTNASYRPPQKCPAER